jgi:hypothetical protein
VQNFFATGAGKKRGRNFFRPGLLSQIVRLIYAAVAAAARCLEVGASSPSQRTLTILETPGSCMVTP